MPPRNSQVPAPIVRDSLAHRYDPWGARVKVANAAAAGNEAQTRQAKSDRYYGYLRQMRDAEAAGHDRATFPQITQHSSDADVKAASERLNRMTGAGAGSGAGAPPSASGSPPPRQASGSAAVDRVPWSPVDASGLKPLIPQDDDSGRTMGAASTPSTVPQIDQPPAGFGSFNRVVRADPNGGPNAIKDDRTVGVQPSAWEALNRSIPGYAKMTPQQRRDATLSRFGGTNRGEVTGRSDELKGYTTPNAGGPVQSGSKFTSPYGTASVTNGPQVNQPPVAGAAPIVPADPENDIKQETMPTVPAPKPADNTAAYEGAVPGNEPASADNPNMAGRSTGNANMQPPAGMAPVADADAPSTVPKPRAPVPTPGQGDFGVHPQIDDAAASIMRAPGAVASWWNNMGGQKVAQPSQVAAKPAATPPAAGNGMDDRESPQASATPPLPQIGPKATETYDEDKADTAMRSNVGQSQLDDEDQWKVA